jgi:hypothetical protein
VVHAQMRISRANPVLAVHDLERSFMLGQPLQ